VDVVDVDNDAFACKHCAMAGAEGAGIYMQHNQHKCRMRHQNVATNGMTITSWVGASARANCVWPANSGNLQIEKLQIIYNLAKVCAKCAAMRRMEMAK